jgi:glycosyltransferase involved in cell wall biosynthesis
VVSKIAIVHSFYRADQPSGENTAVLNEMDALRRAGFDVSLFAAHTDNESLRAGFKLRAAARTATGRGRNPIADIQDFSPDVVHVHNLFPNFGRSWLCGLEAPMIRTLHNFRPLCANGLLLRDGQPCTLCPDGDRLAGFRYGCYQDSRIATLPLTLATRNGPLGDQSFRSAARLIVLSERQRDIYEAAGVPPEMLYLSPQFLPDASTEGELTEDEPDEVDDSWLFVGRLTAEKGILELLDRWPDAAELGVIGDGPLLDAARAKAAGRNNISIEGSRPHAETLRAMKCARGLVFPSLCFEGSPLVYPEALSVGLPVLAFEGNAVADAVTSEGTGAVIHWSETLGDRLPATGARFRQLRSHARTVFLERYSEPAFLARYRALLSSL